MMSGNCGQLGARAVEDYRLQIPDNNTQQKYRPAQVSTSASIDQHKYRPAQSIDQHKVSTSAFDLKMVSACNSIESATSRISFESGILNFES
jgi:hypothetical protein